MAMFNSFLYVYQRVTLFDEIPESLMSHELSPKMLLSELDQPENCEQNWICHSLSTHDIYNNQHISYIVYIYIYI